jgi:hypothetical protein
VLQAEELILYVLTHSNRSHAFAKAGMNEEALQDAIKYAAPTQNSNSIPLPYPLGCAITTSSRCALVGPLLAQSLGVQRLLHRGCCLLEQLQKLAVLRSSGRSPNSDHRQRRGPTGPRTARRRGMCLPAAASFVCGVMGVAGAGAAWS